MINWYRDREPAPFRAIQYDGENGEEIIEFTDGEAYWERIPGYQHKPVLYLREPDMVEELPIGYFVIEGDGGDFFISYEPEEFKRDFEASLRPW